MNTLEAFQTVDVRVGKIVEVLDFPEARKPAYRLKIDLGPEFGIKQSSAQIVAHYTKDVLLGKLVLCVVNLPPRQIGPVLSEVLTLGVPDENKQTVLVIPASNVPLGAKLY